MNTGSYDCHRKPDGCPWSEQVAIGDFSWRYMPDGTLDGMAIILPTPTGQTQSYQPVNPRTPEPQRWGFDGNLDRPTLSPSILLHGCWHGYLIKGRLISC